MEGIASVDAAFPLVSKLLLGTESQVSRNIDRVADRPLRYRGAIPVCAHSRKRNLRSGSSIVPCVAKRWQLRYGAGDVADEVDLP